MVNGAIHRVIEYQAAARPDAPALVVRAGAITYRELNQRANALARRLAASGLTRGAFTLVRMERSIDLATVLLAVLKAGAAYAWIEPGSPGDIDLPSPFCLRRAPAGDERTYLAIDIQHALAECAAKPSPNLPVLTRGSDVACAFLDAVGEPHMLIHHATVTALPPDSMPSGEWAGTPGAFDLWLGLMSGVTITIPETRGVSAAA